jgi:predicted Zn finger-like uncharacterized protein
MPIRTVCPGCRAVYDLHDSLLGRDVRCKKCEQRFVVGVPTKGKPDRSPGVVPVEEAEVVDVLPAAEERLRPQPGRVPPRRRVEPAPPPRLRKLPPAPKPRSVPVPLIVGGALTGLFLLGVAGLAAVWWLQEKPVEDNASRLRAEATAAPQPVDPSAGAKEPMRPAPQGEAAAQAPDNGGKPAAADDAIPLQTLQAIKGATVFIKVESAAESASGSGFLMRADGETGYVVTNHHVVTPSAARGAPGFMEPPFGPPLPFPPVPFGPRFPGGPFGLPDARPVITLVFGSGTPKEFSAPAEVVASDKEPDLALLKVTGVKDLPRPLDCTRQPRLVETMPVYIFGYPFGKALDLNRGNPAVTIGKGSVSSLRLNDRGELALVQLEGDLNPGNSGGPVVDAQGRLVGVSVAHVKGTRIGLAVAPNEVTKLLGGRVASATIARRKANDRATELRGEVWAIDAGHRVSSVTSFTRQFSEGGEAPRPRADGLAEVVVEVQLHDPLDKIKALAVHSLRAVPNQQGMANPAGQWLPLEGAAKVALRREGQKATGALTLAQPDKAPLYLFQIAYTYGEGQTVFTQPHLFNLNPPAQPAPQAVVKPAEPPKVARKPLSDAELKQALADLKSDNLFTRRGAADRLANAEPGGPRGEVAKALEALLNDPDVFARQAGVKALEVWGGKDNVPALLKLVGHTDPFTRWAVIDALGKFKDARAAEPVAERLVDFGDRGHAAQTLRAIGPAAEKAVGKHLTSGDLFLRRDACLILKDIGTKESVPVLEVASKDSNPFVSGAAQEALKAIAERKK